MLIDEKPADSSAKQCACCGAKVVEYRHSFNQALAVGLWRLYTNGGGPINLKDLGLTRNQWDNFQKLRYWGLVAKAHRDDGRRINGAWLVTPTGREFIEGGASIRSRVWTYRGKAVRFEGGHCFFRDTHDGQYEQGPDYAKTARSHIGEQGLKHADEQA